MLNCNKGKLNMYRINARPPWKAMQYYFLISNVHIEKITEQPHCVHKLKEARGSHPMSSSIILLRIF